MENAFVIPQIVSTNYSFQIDNVKDEVLKTLDKYYEKIDIQKKLRYEFFKLTTDHIKERDILRNKLILLYKEILGYEQEFHRLVGMQIINYTNLI